MLELYHHGSSVCAAKVRFALAEKRLGWDGHYVDILAGEQFRSDFLRVNPRAMVPALVHDGHIIIESTVICEYLEEVFSDHPIFPRDPILRAQARVWTKAVDEELHPACSAITYVVSHRHTILRSVQKFEDFLKAPSSDSAEARKVKWQWIEHGLAAPGAPEKIRLYDRYLHKMEESLKDRDWLVGDAFSIADIALAPYVNRLDMMSMNPMWQDGRLPRVEDWFERVRSRPSFKPSFLDWIPDGLRNDLAANGARSWPQVRATLQMQ
ncbi:MAG: glutathione S-transferase family protein [Pseudorhodoplanes sp.]|uniref:glutathione S-transferase family protein n=1 Tax=Pseudorhodoplanes sp. TaxID=1934341 RepID=UPI003D12CC5B